LGTCRNLNFHASQESITQRNVAKSGRLTQILNNNIEAKENFSNSLVCGSFKACEEMVINARTSRVPLQLTSKRYLITWQALGKIKIIGLEQPRESQCLSFS
jgi:hypothetical protein